MTTEQIIEQIGTELKNVEFSAANEEAKIALLNKANEILFPLKEQRVIEDYQFSLSSVGDLVNVSIQIKEFNEDEPSVWDLTVTTS